MGGFIILDGQGGEKFFELIFFYWGFGWVINNKDWCVCVRMQCGDMGIDYVICIQVLICICLLVYVNDLVCVIELDLDDFEFGYLVFGDFEFVYYFFYVCNLFMFFNVWLWNVFCDVDVVYL